MRQMSVLGAGWDSVALRGDGRCGGMLSIPLGEGETPWRVEGMMGTHCGRR
jgi:hypothetical protein